MTGAISNYCIIVIIEPTPTIRSSRPHIVEITIKSLRLFNYFFYFLLFGWLFTITGCCAHWLKKVKGTQSTHLRFRILCAVYFFFFFFQFNLFIIPLSRYDMFSLNLHDGAVRLCCNFCIQMRFMWFFISLVFFFLVSKTVSTVQTMFVCWIKVDELKTDLFKQTNHSQARKH